MKLIWKLNHNVNINVEFPCLETFVIKTVNSK